MQTSQHVVRTREAVQEVRHAWMKQRPHTVERTQDYTSAATLAWLLLEHRSNILAYRWKRSNT
jgi:hypothetical protein